MLSYIIIHGGATVVKGRGLQARIYVGAGGTCPPDSLVAPQIQKLVLP